MAEPLVVRSLERDPTLVVVGVYEREVAASLERVWENVYDWEHLPWIHAQAFEWIERLATGEWGWHARVGFAGGSEAEIELVTDRDARRYVARTRAGAGAPGEIWTTLEPLAEQRTGVRVEFCHRPPIPASARQSIARGYISLYELLWDQDEEMMQTRESALRMQAAARFAEQPAPKEIVLGRIDALRSRLPFSVEIDGHPYRIAELPGENRVRAASRTGNDVVGLDRRHDALVVYSTVCPHMLGPLGDCELEEGLLTCPWHGYRFDPRTGRSADGRALRLRRPPRLTIEERTGQVRLIVGDE
jgi:nitrite reductase/ring-hydroxylating ferredoxin subunit